MTIEDTYLGDGVYASFDGYHIVLDLRAQGTDRIALEPQVLEALDAYRKRIALLGKAGGEE
jgi:hypothetical protein